MYMNIAFDNICCKGSVLSQTARFVYLCLCKHADNTNQTCFPSINRIAEIVGKSISTIKRAVRELCKYGAIERTPRFRKDGGQTSNLYRIKEIDLDALNYETESDNEQPCQCPLSQDDISLSVTNNCEPARACTPGQDEKVSYTLMDKHLDTAEESGILKEIFSVIVPVIDIYTEKPTEAKDENTGILITNESNNRLINWLMKFKYRVEQLKADIFCKNELGGGHGRPSKNLSI